MAEQTRVILLTGATDGLGRALAERLSSRTGTTLILHGRSAERLAALADELGGAGAAVHTAIADFTDLAQVHALAAQVAELTDHLSVLVNNAGIGAGDGTREVSADGHELRFAVNHLAAFALTNDLVPLLERGAPSRVVNVASLGQSPVDLDDLALTRDYEGHRAYTRSKLAMVAAGFALADRLDSSRVTVNSLHPASFMPTKMVLDSGAQPIDTLESGVEATLRLVLDPALDGVSGEFFKGTESARALEQAYDHDFRNRLWDASVRLTTPRAAEHINAT